MATNWEAADTENVWINESNEPGPTVIVLGSVHGDELAGSMVIDQARYNMGIDCGKLIMAIGNPEAVKQRIRFTDTNLNRCFRPLTEEEQEQDPSEWPYELRRAQELMPYMDESQAALDMHQHQYMGSGPFIICEPNAFEAAKAIGAPIISFGWSKTEPGGTDGYMYEQGKVGICYELGAMQQPTPSQRLGAEVVPRFLATQGLIDEQFPPLFGNPTFVRAKEAYIRKDMTYKLAKNFKNFENLRGNLFVAFDGRTTVYAEQDDVIIFPDPNPRIGAEAFTIGEIVDPSNLGIE